MPKYWMGVVSKCDVCDKELTTIMYDMKTRMGPWACMCSNCAMGGIGIGKLGLGLGQEYKKQPDGKWLKTAG